MGDKYLDLIKINGLPVTVYVSHAKYSHHQKRMSKSIESHSCYIWFGHLPWSFYIIWLLYLNISFITFPKEDNVTLVRKDSYNI